MCGGRKRVYKCGWKLAIHATDRRKSEKLSEVALTQFVVSIVNRKKLYYIKYKDPLV